MKIRGPGHPVLPFENGHKFIVYASKAGNTYVCTECSLEIAKTGVWRFAGTIVWKTYPEEMPKSCSEAKMCVALE